MTKITVAVREIEALADRLGSVSGERLSRIATDVVNEVTVDFQEKAITGGLANINLDRAYFKSKTDLSLATPGTQPRAEIVTRGDLTVIGRFAPVATVRAPGAKRRAGAIAGQRNAGLIVGIRKSASIKQDQWFSMPLRRGDIPGGNGLGAFVKDDSIAPRNDRGPGLGDAGRRRDGKAGKRHIYGPSPYALFREQITRQGPALEDNLATRASRDLLAEINKVNR